VDGFVDIGAVSLDRLLAATNEAGLVQVGVLRGMQTGAGRVVRSDPAFPVVVQIAERDEVLLPAGRAGFEIPAACQIQTEEAKVQFMMPGMTVRTQRILR
jgi:hypothetical protein